MEQPKREGKTNESDKKQADNNHNILEELISVSELECLTTIHGCLEI